MKRFIVIIILVCLSGCLSVCVRSNFYILLPILFKLGTQTSYVKSSIARGFQPAGSNPLGAGGGTRSHVDLCMFLLHIFIDKPLTTHDMSIHVSHFKSCHAKSHHVKSSQNIIKITDVYFFIFMITFIC